ncbi:hypothetical protein BH11MYX4_BH11MYX4_60210 [soil metagenome]
MAEPPPKPKKGPDDLAEVERALSVLQGRHPEHERARREDAATRQRRAVEIDSVAQDEAKRVRARRAKLIAVATPVVVLFAFIAIFGRREMARRARIDAVSESFRAAGFTAIDTSLRGSTGAVEATAEAGCMLAVSTHGKPLSITRGGLTLSASPPALFCTCAAEKIAVTSPVGGEGGIALLRAETSLVGGSRAFGFAPFKPASTLVTDEPCADASLDAWVDAKHYPAGAADDAWLKGAPQRALLASAGFHVVALARAEAPFAVVELPKDSCLVVTSAGADDRLAVRLKGEAAAALEGRGSLGRCAQAEGTVVVSREGRGELVVLVGPAAGVGGELGLRETMKSVGLAPSALAVPPGDRSWDAKQVLLASAIPVALIDTAAAPDVPPFAEGRIVALSLETQGALVPELAPGVESSCTPPLGEATREALCIFSGPQKWKSPGGGDNPPVGGLARSKLPFWLYTMSNVRDRAALEGLSKLLTLARSLAREGFAPTTLEALVEQPNGVQVLGRTGEDAVVAVGVAPSDPWVYPLTDGDAWTLDGPPQIALVKPLQQVTLVSMLKQLPPIHTRRTVVFRRQKR